MAAAKSIQVGDTVKYTEAYLNAGPAIHRALSRSRGKVLEVSHRFGQAVARVKWTTPYTGEAYIYLYHLAVAS